MQIILLALGASGAALIWWWWGHEVISVVFTSMIIGSFLLGLAAWGTLLLQALNRETERLAAEQCAAERRDAAQLERLSRKRTASLGSR